MLEQVAERCGAAPAQWLVDGGYPAHEQLDAVAEKTEVYAPVPKAKDGNTDVHQPKPGDSAAVADWRKRMGSDDARTIYKQRAAIAECVNAQARNRGLTRLLVRGKAKVKCVVLLHALAHNLMRMVGLAPQFFTGRRGASSVAGWIVATG